MKIDLTSNLAYKKEGSVQNDFYKQKETGTKKLYQVKRGEEGYCKITLL